VSKTFQESHKTQQRRNRLKNHRQDKNTINTTIQEIKLKACSKEAKFGRKERGILAAHVEQK